MAQKIQVLLTDDLTGEDADETVGFSLDGISYEIDLTEANAEALREALEPFVAVGRRTGGRSTRRKPISLPSSVPAQRRQEVDADPKTVRAWAASTGLAVSAKGRIAAEVMEAFKAAH